MLRHRTSAGQRTPQCASVLGQRRVSEPGLGVSGIAVRGAGFTDARGRAASEQSEIVTTGLTYQAQTVIYS
jgi:hypothetical protein